ncbi:unnamed protein product [Protopolystoma xenopodis]|uniref:Uncharacterized protein n=1 Tax=Protopolystoma xenopodis TaxID=117903 RepID=A0A3S5FG90_9PLAT|nr:unnamed protein product [Protopolystoma xenopodis]
MLASRIFFRDFCKDILPLLVGTDTQLSSFWPNDRVPLRNSKSYPSAKLTGAEECVNTEQDDETTFRERTRTEENKCRMDRPKAQKTVQKVEKFQNDCMEEDREEQDKLVPTSTRTFSYDNFRSFLILANEKLMHLKEIKLLINLAKKEVKYLYLIINDIGLFS